eukprot:15122-Heterococcus_DN1.PRE.3
MNPIEGTVVPSSTAASMDVVQTPTETLRAAVPATVQPEVPEREIQPAPIQRAQEIFSSQLKPAAQAVKLAPSAPALSHSAMVVDAPASAASSLSGSALEPKRRGRPPKTKTSNSAPAAAPAAVPGASSSSSMSQLKPAGALMPPPSERSMPFFDVPSRSADHPQQHSSIMSSSSKPNGSGGLQRGDRPASFASFTGGLNGLSIASPRESEKERSSNSSSASFAMSSPPAAAAAAAGGSSSSSSS